MKEIIFAGFGGQGVLTGGLIIAYMAAGKELEAVWMPAYGPTMRGGKANCTVKYGEEPGERIGSPVMEEADILIAMNEPSLDYLEFCKPDAKVFVNSIIPAIDPAFERGPAWRSIPEYNAAVKAYCAENGVSYIDITQLCADNQSLYQADGVHMMSEFYPKWAIEMISEVYADDFSDTGAGDAG